MYTDTIKSIYNNFPIMRGVRQGDPLSPKILIPILDVIIKRLDWSNIKEFIYIESS